MIDHTLAFAKEADSQLCCMYVSNNVGRVEV